MTLDLTKITGKLDELAETLDPEEAVRRDVALEGAYTSLDSSELRQRLLSAKTSWLLAHSHGDLNARFPLPAVPDDYTVVASDGSFILPDRHTPARFYVINIGKVLLRYGSDVAAELSADAQMYFQEDELYVPHQVRRIPVNGVVLGMKRAVEELQAVAEVAAAQPRPAVALQDGTLILWGLESQPDFVIDWVLDSFMESLQRLRDENIPVGAFISFPASSDVMNSLRVSVCDYPDQGMAVNCDHCRGRIATEGRVPACDVLPNVSDRYLFERIASLQPGERSQVFASSSKILDRYDPDCQIHFFYLHTGSEIARVEIPQWVAADQDQLDILHAVVTDQCERGRGYPSALQEAHELAAIRPDERRAVEVLIEEAMARKGIVLRRSGKEESKRGRFV